MARVLHPPPMSHWKKSVLVGYTWLVRLASLLGGIEGDLSSLQDEEHRQHHAVHVALVGL